MICAYRSVIGECMDPCTIKEEIMKIVYEKDNDCVGCPQGCINCGRGWYEYAVAITCEGCGEEVDTVYEVDGGNYCDKCALEELPKTTVDDINEEI